jgi:hypothetical protein
MIERVFEVNLGTDATVEGFVSVPRGYLVAAALTVIAGAVYVRSMRKDELLEVVSLK